MSLAMSEAGLEEEEIYDTPCQNTATQYITIRMTMDLNLDIERRPGAIVSMRRKEKVSLDLLGVREVK